MDIKKKLVEFYRPSLMKVAYSIMFFIVLIFLTQIFIFTKINIIPCNIYVDNIIETKGFCPINPTSPEVSTLYLYNKVLDDIYVFLYFVMVFLFMPYNTSCLFIQYLIKKNPRVY